MVPFIPLTSVAGFLIGGFMEKSRLNEAKEKGNEVSKPSFWNKDTMIGVGAGYFGGLVIGGVATAVATVAATAGSPDPVQALHTALPVAGLSPLIVVGGGLAGALTGGLIGGKIGEARMEKEWQEAKQYVAEHGEYQGKAAELAKQAQPQVTQNIYVATPEEAALLQSRMSGQNKPMNFVERVAAPANAVMAK